MDIKRIIREEIDDMGWIRDTQPSIFDSLHAATINNPNINVIFKDLFDRIEDVEGQNYFGSSELNDYFGSGRLENISKGELLIFIKEQQIDPSWEYGNPEYEDDQDYNDYMELYKLVETL